MKNSGEIKLQARIALQGKTGLFCVACLIYVYIVIMVALIGLVPYVGSSLPTIISFLITGPFSLGFAIMSLRVARGQDINVADMFEGFRQYVSALLAYLIVNVLVFLWSLLLIVPGIIKSLSYSMTFFIIADDKNISPNDARIRSMDMMDGYKWRLFCLELSFIGWIILGIFTFGILYIWLLPYMNTSLAIFYTEVKEVYDERIRLIYGGAQTPPADPFEGVGDVAKDTDDVHSEEEKTDDEEKCVPELPAAQTETAAEPSAETPQTPDEGDK